MSDIHWRHPDNSVKGRGIGHGSRYPTLCGDWVSFMYLRYLDTTYHVNVPILVTCVACVLLKFEAESRGVEWIESGNIHVTVQEPMKDGCR